MSASAPNDPILPTTTPSASALKFQPKPSTARRTHEQRAEHEKQLARHATTTAAASSSAAAATTSGRGGGSGFRGGFRGGLSGWRMERRPAGGASGPLGGPVEGGKGSGKGRGGTATTTSTARREPGDGVVGKSTQSGGRAAGVVVMGSERGAAAAAQGGQRAGIEKRGPESGGRGRRAASGKNSVAQVKQEEDILVEVMPDDDSDDDDDDDKKTGIGRINIDHINLISDDDDEGAEENEQFPTPSAAAAGTHRYAHADHPPSWSLKPVRLAREDASRANAANAVLTSAQLRQKARAKAEEDGGLFVPADDEPDTAASEPKGSKGRSRDVELAQHTSHFKGVYSDDDDEDNSEELPRSSKQPASAIPAPKKRLFRSLLDEDNNNTDSVNATSIHKGTRPGSLFAKRKPILHTTADLEEWQRSVNDRRAIAEELGPFRPDAGNKNPDPDIDSDSNNDNDNDDNGDNTMPDRAISMTDQNTTDSLLPPTPPRDRKDGFTYVFQLPPILPQLIDPNVAQSYLEHPSSHPHPHPPHPLHPGRAPPSSHHQVPPLDTSPSSATPLFALTASNVNDAPLIRINDGENHDDHKGINTIATATATTATATATAVLAPAAFTGCVGTLRVYAGGTVILTWGGVAFDVAVGRKSAVLEDVVLADFGGGRGGVERAAAAAGADLERSGIEARSDLGSGKEREREKGKGKGKGKEKEKGKGREKGKETEDLRESEREREREMADESEREGGGGGRKEEAERGAGMKVVNAVGQVMGTFVVTPRWEELLV